MIGWFRRSVAVQEIRRAGRRLRTSASISTTIARTTPSLAAWCASPKNGRLLQLQVAAVPKAFVHNVRPSRPAIERNSPDLAIPFERLTKYKAARLNRTVVTSAKLCSRAKIAPHYRQIRRRGDSPPQHRLGGINGAADITQAVRTIASKKQRSVQVDDARLLRHKHRRRHGE